MGNETNWVWRGQLTQTRWRDGTDGEETLGGLVAERDEEKARSVPHDAGRGNDPWQINRQSTTETTPVAQHTAVGVKREDGRVLGQADSGDGQLGDTHRAPRGATTRPQVVRRRRVPEGRPPAPVLRSAVLRSAVWGGVFCARER